jgi:hypothetical protein
MRSIKLMSMMGLMGVALSMSAPVHAELLGGNAGHSWPDLAEPDLRNNWSAIDNFGTVARQWIIPLSVPTSGRYTVSVRYRGTGLAATKCRAITFDANNGGYHGTASVPVLSTGYEWKRLGDLNVPTNGALQVECELPGKNGPLTASVLRVNYSKAP